VVTCFGEPDVPEVEDLPFEPEIITPTRAVWRQLIWLAIVAGLIGMWLLDYLNMLPGWFPNPAAHWMGFLYFIFPAVGVLATWIWTSMIRPTYIRLAPGVIQVLVYPLRPGKPTIRSYPMEVGTLAVLTRVGKRVTLVLSRGANHDTLPLSRMDHPEQRLEQAWRAILSTAPTPPLSDDELLG
jgi:hypothetical protein